MLLQTISHPILLGRIPWIASSTLCRWCGHCDLLPQGGTKCFGEPRSRAGPGLARVVGRWSLFLGFDDDDDDDDDDDVFFHVFFSHVFSMFFPMGNPRLCESIGHLVDFAGRSLSKFESFQGVCYGNSTFYHQKNEMGTCPTI